MDALKPLAFLLIAMAAGAVLAMASLAVDLPAGWIGALVLILWAILMRRRWARLEADGREPGAPERVLWLRLAGAALILGHLIAAILLLGDALRLGSGNSLAIDSWTMILGHQIAAFLFRSDIRQQDERHAPIVARGVRVGYATLILIQIPLLAWMVVMPLALRTLLTHFVLANVLVAFMCVSYAAMLLAQLIAYARDAEEMRRAEAGQPFP
jgi:hypothetical protein